MEHYFIYICNDKPSSEEHTLVLNYIHSLLPLPGYISHIHSDINSVPLLKCNSSYLTVINACSEEETVQWKNTTVELNLSHLLCDLKKEDQQKVLEDSNNISKDLEDSLLKDDIDKDKVLSILLNSLADDLPLNGSHKLDIIISQNVLKGLSPLQDIKFAGSLYRLLQWHSAHTVIIVPQGEDEVNVEEWCDIVEAEVVKGTIDPFLGPLIWRGSIQFKNSEISYSGFQLRLDPLESEIIFGDTASLSSDIKTIPYEYLALSLNLQAIHECSFTSVPIYLILPIAFRLYICEPNIYYGNSRKLLESFSQNNGAALIVRLKYTILHEKPKPDKSLSTSKWQKMISSGSIKGPDSTFPILEKYLTLAITTSPKSGHVVAYPLRDPSSLDAKFYFDIVNLRESKSQYSKALKTSATDLLMFEVPYLSQHSLQKIVNIINFMGLCSKATCHNGEHSSSDICCCLESFLKSVAKNLTSCLFALDNCDLHVLEEEIDPSDWPERVHLLQKQMKIDKEKIKAQPIFRNLSPQHSQNTISFTSKDAEKYFLPTGEPKDATATGSPSVVPKDIKPEQDFNKLQNAEWPEALTCKNSDVYYNSDKQAEDKEAVGNEMVRFYVQHETACTCNNQQYRTDSTILIRSKSKPSNQKYRSPATPRSFSRIKQKLQKSNAPSDRKTTKTNIPSAKLKKNNSSEKTVVKGYKVKGKLPPKRNVLPVRCSPRKKIPVKHSQPASSSGELKRKNSDPQQLPEILKKKLRVAVASALEKNGINLKDAFFRPCGKRLFTICQAFVQDIPRQKGSTSEHMQKIADAHVKQVIEFEKLRLSNVQDEGKQDAGDLSL